MADSNKGFEARVFVLAAEGTAIFSGTSAWRLLNNSFQTSPNKESRRNLCVYCNAQRVSWIAHLQIRRQVRDTTRISLQAPRLRRSKVQGQKPTPSNDNCVCVDGNLCVGTNDRSRRRRTGKLSLDRNNFATPTKLEWQIHNKYTVLEHVCSLNSLNYVRHCLSRNGCRNLEWRNMA